MNKKESKFDEAKVLKAGTVIVWASYGKIKSFFAKLFSTELFANRAVILGEDCKLVDMIEKYNIQDWFMLYTPKMQYSKTEKLKLNQLLTAYEYTPDIMYNSGIDIINKIRPETVPGEYKPNMSILLFSKYYKSVM